MNFSDILREKVEGWAQCDQQRLVVAHDAPDKLALPAGIRYSRQKLKGKRRANKGLRIFSDHTHITAMWERDHLVETKEPTLICVAEGEARLPFGETVLICRSGSFVWVPSNVPRPRGRNTPHLTPEAQKRGEPCDVMWFTRHAQAIHCWMCHSRGMTHRHDRTENYLVMSPRAVELFDLMALEAQDRKPGHELVMHDLLHAFVVVLVREFEAGHFLHPGVMSKENEAPRERQSDQEDPMQVIQQYVRAHLSEPLTIDDAARRVYMSRTLFTRRFRESTGLSFLEYVTQCRINQAKLLLTSSPLSVNKICEFVGFKSASRFYSLFKQKTGVSPNEYRASGEKSAKEAETGD